MWKDSHATSMPSTSGAKASYVAEIPRRLAFLAIQGLWTKHCLENKSPELVCHRCTLLTGEKYFWCDTFWQKEVYIQCSGFFQSIVEISTLLLGVAFKAHKKWEREGNPNITEVQFSFYVRFLAHWCRTNVAKVYSYCPRSVPLALQQ